MGYIRHLIYLVRHKWFVLQAGRRRGVALWQLVIHDWSKFLPDEFIPYTRHFFYGGIYSGVTLQDYRLAFTKHYRRNPHHWEHWDRSSGPLRMPDRYVHEMLADWDGAGMAKTDGVSTVAWYAANRDSIRLHPLTRVVVDFKLGHPDAALAAYLRECPKCGELFYNNVAILTNGDRLTDAQLPAVLERLGIAHEAH